MKKQQLATRLAKNSGMTRAQAADQLDQVVHQILTNLRKGRTAPLPGLGRFTPGRTWNFEFDPAAGKGNSGRDRE